MNKIVDGDDLFEIWKLLINKLSHTRSFIFIDIEEIKDAVSNAVAKYLERQNDANSTEEFESKAKVEAWLYRISKNSLLNVIKSKLIDNDNKTEYLLHLKNGYEDIGKDNEIVNMWKIINQSEIFDSIDKVILQEHYIEGKELKSISEELKKTPNAIYIKKCRLIEKIKKIMEEKNIKNMKDLDF